MFNSNDFFKTKTLSQYETYEEFNFNTCDDLKNFILMNIHLSPGKLIKLLNT